MLSIILISCEKDIIIPENELIERKDIVLTRSQMDFVQSNNKFALDLFNKVSEEEDGKSMVISPLSVTFALGMVNNGTVGEAQREINKVLGYEGDTIDDLNSFCKTILKQITEIDPSTKLEIANMVLANEELVQLKEEFIQSVQDSFEALVCYKDFSKEDIQDYINHWCEKKTHGMIKEFYNRKISKSTIIMLLNATYFKGIWASKFKKNDTEKEKFTQMDGSKIIVNMMHQQDKFNYGEIGGICKMLTLPYGNQAFSMVLVLPEKDKTIDDLKISLNKDLWSKIIDNQRGLETDVKIPSFKTEFGTKSIRNALKELGIEKVFSGLSGAYGQGVPLPNANFSEEFRISDIEHKTIITVDEEGSEAAAITTAIAVASSNGHSSEPESKVFEFHADRPFIYAITEVSTGAIIFMGQYTGR